MKYAIGWIRTKPGLRDDFLAQCQSFIAATRAEAGVIAFEPLPGQD